MTNQRERQQHQEQKRIHIKYTLSAHARRTRVTSDQIAIGFGVGATYLRRIPLNIRALSAKINHQGTPAFHVNILNTV